MDFMAPRFIFVVCQNGAEAVCKSEILSNHSDLKFAFSRPGFLTFKDEKESLPNKFVLKSTFARTYGWSVGNLNSDDISAQIDNLFHCEKQLVDSQHLHVWQRDSRIPGTGGFEPGQSVLAEQIGQRLCSEIDIRLKTKLQANRIAKVDQQIFDVILVDPNYWFLGYHFATTKFQRWPGGTPLVETTEPVVSRAYFKLLEALLWTGIQINPGDICAEIGSSPGGACQLLLEKQAKVIAIDPADLDPEIAENENLVFFRCRAKEIRKKELKDVRWLLSDVNEAPNYTLDAIEEIVTNQNTKKVKGLILTLKLTDLNLAKNIPQWIRRVREFGFQMVKTRQLAFNRKEICLMAVRDRFALRSTKKR